MPASTKPMKSEGTSFTIDSQKIGHLTSIGELAQDSEEIDVTTLDSEGAYREFIQGFRDGGTLALEGYYVPGDTTQAKLNTLYKSGESKSCEIGFSDGSKITFDGYVKGVTFGPSAVDGVPGFGATIRVTGEVTESPAV